MKKLLILLGTISLTAVATTSVVACGPVDTDFSYNNKEDLINKWDYKYKPSINVPKVTAKIEADEEAIISQQEIDEVLSTLQDSYKTNEEAIAAINSLTLTGVKFDGKIKESTKSIVETTFVITIVTEENYSLAEGVNNEQEKTIKIGEENTSDIQSISFLQYDDSKNFKWNDNSISAQIMRMSLSTFNNIANFIDEAANGQIDFFYPGNNNVKPIDKPWIELKFYKSLNSTEIIKDENELIQYIEEYKLTEFYINLSTNKLTNTSREKITINTESKNADYLDLWNYTHKNTSFENPYILDGTYNKFKEPEVEDEKFKDAAKTVYAQELSNVLFGGSYKPLYEVKDLSDYKFVEINGKQSIQRFTLKNRVQDEIKSQLSDGLQEFTILGGFKFKINTK